LVKSVKTYQEKKSKVNAMVGPFQTGRNNFMIAYEGNLLDSPGVLIVLSNQDTGVVCELLHGENYLSKR
jgi:hypothetical protein